MIEIKSLGTITDEAIANINWDDDGFGIDFNLCDLSPKLQKNIMDKLKNSGRDEKNIKEIIFSFIIDVKKGRMYSDLYVYIDFVLDGEKEIAFGISLNRAEQKTFIRKIIVPYINSFVYKPFIFDD